MKNKFLHIFAGGLLVFSQLFAEAPWQKLEGPYGGIITRLTRTQTDKLVAIFDQTLSMSSDDGLSWTPISNNAHTFKLGLDDHFYVESLSRELYVSENQGASWDALPQTINGLQLQRIAIAPNGTLYFAANERLYVSTNRGQEWTVLASQFNNNAARVMLNARNDIFVYGNNQLYLKTNDSEDFSLVLDAEKPIRAVLQNAQGDIFASIGDQTGTIVKSTDLGATWSPTTLPFALSLYESENGTLFGATSTPDHIVEINSFMSTTGGDTWLPVSVGAPVFGFAMNGAGDIFAASDGLFVSKNLGTTFNLISPQNATIYNVLNPSANQLFCVTGINKHYARFWNSQNNGATWTRIGKEEFNQPAAYVDAKVIGQNRIWLLLGYSSGSDTTLTSSAMYESRDGGRSWRHIRNFDKPAGFDFDKSRNTVYVWMSGQNYYFRTDDFGVAWIPISLPFDAGQFFAASNGLIYGYSKSDIGRIRRLYRSFNKGDTWNYKDIPFNESGIARLAVDRFGHVYKLTALPQKENTYSLSSLMRSVNYGDSFSNIAPEDTNLLQPSNSMYCIATDPHGALYFTGSTGLLLSRNNGTNWQNIFTSETQGAEVRCVHANTNANVYVGTFSDGILTTSNKPTYFVPQLIDGLEIPIAATFGVNWIDYDADGFDDIFLVNDGPNMLFKNNRDGTFRRITTGSIVTDDQPSRSASWVDYNNDGYLDCFVANGVKDVYNSLYKNNGDGTFKRITDGNIVEDYGDYRSSAWADVDNDGDLDLYVTEVSEEYPNILYINDGTNHFTKSTDPVIGNKAERTYDCGWCDFDNDGDVDIYLANQGADQLFEQVRPGQFALVGSDRIQTNMGAAVSCSWGDYNNDGFMDLFVVNYDMPNCLYRNNGDGSFTKVSAPEISTDNKISKGSGWADYDNDGDLDLFVVNRDSYLFYTNDGAGNFTKDEMNEFTYHGGNALAVAWGDKDNNGALEPVIASYDQQSLIYHNVGHGNNWFKIRCTGNKSSNHSALGAKIRIVTTIDNKKYSQIRHISASSGHASQNSLVQHFGLGAATRVDSIIIQWPSGKKQTLLNRDANQRITVVESGTNAVEQRDNHKIPLHFSLAQNYPNPFNPTTTIAYELAEKTFVSLSIYDINGHHIKSLVNTLKQAGAHSVQWDGTNENGSAVASGLYVYKIVTENYKDAGKMTLLR